jgi:hypothetical protein
LALGKPFTSHFIILPRLHPQNLVNCFLLSSTQRFAVAEMEQVKMQTSKQGTFPTAFGPALREIRANAAETRFPYGSLVPLWGRQSAFFRE